MPHSRDRHSSLLKCPVRIWNLRLLLPESAAMDTGPLKGSRMEQMLYISFYVLHKINNKQTPRNGAIILSCKSDPTQSVRAWLLRLKAVSRNPQWNITSVIHLLLFGLRMFTDRAPQNHTAKPKQRRKENLVVFMFKLQSLCKIQYSATLQHF